MKKFSTDWIALVTAGIGMVLMILTAVWRVNPVEGSVVPDFLESNLFGKALLFVLLVTCMPVWIPTVFIAVQLLGESEFALANTVAVIVQGLVFYMIGRLISIWAEFRTERRRTQ